MKNTKVQTCPFFVASCGCIGLDIGGDEYIIIKSCCGEPHEDRISLFHRMGFDEDKNYEPLSPQAANELIKAIEQLTYLGYRLLDVRQALGGAIPNLETPLLDQEAAAYEKAEHQRNLAKFRAERQAAN